MKRDFWRNVKLLLARLSHLDVNEQQQREIDYLREETQTLRDCLKATGKRMILTDAQRKNLSIKAVALGKRLEAYVVQAAFPRASASIPVPETVTDFFTAEVWTPFWLVTCYVLFFIHLGTRKVRVAGITEHPSAEWVEQQARNMTGFDGELFRAGYQIHDRDSKYTVRFDHIMKEIGVKPIRLPLRSPNLNSVAERFVLSIKSECLDRFIPIGEKSLRMAISNYMEFYHAERPHQSLGNKPLRPENEPVRPQAGLPAGNAWAAF